MEDPEEPPPMQKDVHIIVQVIVRKGEPLPPPEKAQPLPILENDGEEVAGEGEGQDAEGNGEEEEEPSGEEGPKPSLEELGVKFVLSTFNGESLERYVSTFHLAVSHFPFFGRSACGYIITSTTPDISSYATAIAVIL
jgi:hypothetical protein